MFPRSVTWPYLSSLILAGFAFSPYLNGAELSPVERMGFEKDLTYLGSDLCGGRGTGTQGARVAARYLSQRMKEIGLKPMGSEGSYYQKILMHGSRVLPESRLQIYARDESQILEPGRDYLLYQMGDKTFIPKPAPLVFVGFGIVAPEYDYNDYQNISVENAIVVYFEGEPSSNDPDFFSGVANTLHSLPEMKQRVAVSRGALGSIAIPRPEEADNWSYWVQTFAFEHVTLPYQVSNGLAIMMHPKKAEVLFQQAPYNLRQVWEMVDKNNLKSFPMNERVSFEGRFQQREFIDANLVGMLEGTVPSRRDQYVLVSAHYDHLGMGPELGGDSIYNGVVDNASGTAAVLEIARILAASPPEQSIIFLLVTGEEKGLLGSYYYTENPVVPLYRTTAAVNVDGLAILDRFHDVVGVGAELSTLGEELWKVALGMGLKLSPMDPELKAMDHFSRSDQLSFAQAGIPSIMVYEGFDYVNLGREMGKKAFLDWGRDRYHSPFDDLGQPINFDAVLLHLEVITRFVYHLANLTNGPQWYPGSEYQRTRLRSLAEKR